MSDITKLMQEISLLKSQLAMLQNDLEARRSDEINAVVTRDLQPRQVLASQEPSKTTLKPFDISEDTTSTVLKLTTRLADTKPFTGLRGVVKEVSAGTGWAWSTPLFSATLTAATLIYLKYTRSTAAVSIEKTTDTAENVFITPDDYSYRPLWYIEWTGGAIDVENSIDLRESYIIEGIS
jgi:hypothetical protein